MALEIVILAQCEKELKGLPREVLEDLLDAISKLKLGLNLEMPLSRPLGNIYKSLHELRLKDQKGIYRIFYFIKKGDAIYIIHAYQKKTQEIPKKNIGILKKRLRSIP